MNILKTIIVIGTLFGSIGLSYAKMLTIPMQLTAKSGVGKSVGTVTAKDTKYGLLLTPNLHGLPTDSYGGIHGFHIHQSPNCTDSGLAAHGHFDPKHTDKHLGPYNAKGHLGDLPVLIVNNKGEANTPILAPRLTTKKIVGHALMIHQGGDNYSDIPAKLGGGGKRVACGVIKK